ARENSHVVARENSHVVARENSHVVAWGNSHVEARENSHVVARENSHVVAWENSHVVAWGNSHVVAWGNVSVTVQSKFSGIELFGFAVAILLTKCKVYKKSKTCTFVTPPVSSKGNNGWLERHGIAAKKKVVTLFKKVSSDFKTQENNPNETLWKVGSTVEHPAWRPEEEECGEGKFHACGRPYFCDEFRNEPGDRYIAISVAVVDLHAWDGGQYPHKIAFRKATVLFECDKFGAKLSK
ncbi:MAG: hypothetical protein WBD81_18075, partial [Collimonas pratensis]|uniref:hypothetical protein n=1 Tax=Collimonas pratensis TaxID=279113 RepID=UPI003C7820C4